MNCIVDDLLKAVGHTDDRRRVMTDAEVLRTALLAAHRRYFCGVKAQVVTTEGGVPVEFAFLPGSASDVRGLEVLPLALPEDSELFMDSG